MSYYDISKLTKEDLIAQYFIEMRNAGAFLSYHDYQIIDSWLKASENDTGLIISLLHEEFEYQESLGRGSKLSLKRIYKKIHRKIINAKTKLSV